MDAGQGASRGWLRGRLLPTAAVCLAFLALEAGVLPTGAAGWASNLMQLGLAAAAAWSCFRTAAREAGLTRPFFLLVGLGMALWAAGQGLWTLGPIAGPSPLRVAFRDLLFVISTTPLIAACALRPHEPRPGARGLAADVGLLTVLAIVLYVYFPIASAFAGSGAASSSLPALLFNPQRVMLLLAMLWLLRGARPPWRRLFEELALAMAVFHGLGPLSNAAIEAGTYRPGTLDLPWAVPFLWVALAARDWSPLRDKPAQAEAGSRYGWEPQSFSAARRGNALALVAVALVPGVHQLATLVGDPAPGVAPLRSSIALVSTLVVAALYLTRQLYTLKHAEATQQARDARFRALVELSADAIGVVDGAACVSYLSPSSQRVTGHAPEELRGTDVLELVPPEDRGALRQAFAEIAAQPGARAQREVRFVHATLGVRHGALEALNLSASPAVGGIVLHLRDVTERRQAEEERERSLSLLEATLESTADGILVVANGRVVRFNQKFAAMWRLPQDVLADPDAARMRRAAADELAEPAAFLEALDRLDARPEAEGFDTLRLRDGRVFERYSLPQRLQGVVVGRVYSFRDVTERVHAELALRRSHTMAALGSLVAGVAHEVRNPLFGISSTLDAFEARFDQHDHGQYVRVLREQLERLSVLMNDLLDYARPVTLELVQGRFESVVEASLAACAPLQRKTGVSIETRLEPGLPPLRMDARRITQVLQNLLENAVQHAREAGSVRLEARLAHKDGAAWVECCVEDDGPGFRPDDLPHVFEPFFTRRHGGTGLGLSIVHRIVSDHGGSISADNRPEGGARLTLSLPALAPPQATS